MEIFHFMACWYTGVLSKVLQVIRVSRKVKLFLYRVSNSHDYNVVVVAHIF
jgi:hypothetical protein